jgi:hypothetical protein
MGYAIVYGDCVACGAVIGFNPRRVPSIRVRGSKEPLCRGCAERWIVLHPEAAFVIPPDAYEAVDEREL